MKEQSNFIKTIMEDDLNNGKHTEISTRFPPEPNGFLHIGHARAIVTNFELAKLFGGKTNLRFDDTNPEKEEDKYVKAIIEDVKWLGYEPNQILYASDYFQEMYDRAIILIQKGLAFVDDLSAQEIAEHRGSITEPGKESPYRNRTIEENLELFENMRNGLYKEGEKVLRAKIDMASPNMNMRDPVLYRISYSEHHNTGKKWCIYPMYDYAHPLEDAIEGITHSLCSLEFEDHRPLYDWVVRETEIPSIPRQIEFGRLGIENTVMSKRYLKQLVDSKLVTGWDDPRMPTLSGVRRRGYTPNAIKSFILSTGLSKINSTVSKDMLEAAIRDDLQEVSKRAMAVINPLKVTITNYPEDQLEYLTAPYHPENDLGERQIAFGRNLYIEKEDFEEVKPNKKFKRLSLGEEVRLFNAYFIKATGVVKNDEGKIIEVLATYDVETKSGSGFDARKPNGTIHFVEATTAVNATFNFFEDLLDSDETKPLENRFNNQSWIIKEGFVEASIATANNLEKFQFLRLGYFSIDQKEGKQMNFNEVVPLKSSYKK